MSDFRSFQRTIPTYFGVEVWALLHERPDGEPEAVGHRELVLNGLGSRAGVRILPLVRRETGHDEHGDGHEDVRG